MTEHDLSDVPTEVTDYAFDQLADRLTGPECREQMIAALEMEQIRYNHDEQTVVIETNPIEGVLLDAMREKIRDIEYEIRHDERSDHDIEDISRWRSRLKQHFK